MLLITGINYLVVSKGEDSPAKDSRMLNSLREFGSFTLKENEYKRVCVFLKNTICIYRTFWAFNPCDKTGNIILTNIIKITTYLE